MENLFGFIITVIIIVNVGKFIYLMWDLSTRPERFASVIQNLNKRKCKITYQNESTGTISYIENGVKNQTSVYRGYNSHARW